MKMWSRTSPACWVTWNVSYIFVRAKHSCRSSQSRTRVPLLPCHTSRTSRAPSAARSRVEADYFLALSSSFHARSIRSTSSETRKQSCRCSYSWYIILVCAMLRYYRYCRLDIWDLDPLCSGRILLFPVDFSLHTSSLVCLQLDKSCRRKVSLALDGTDMLDGPRRWDTPSVDRFARSYPFQIGNLQSSSASVPLLLLDCQLDK
jgi:hypothetical protein